MQNKSGVLHPDASSTTKALTASAFLSGVAFAKTDVRHIAADKFKAPASQVVVDAKRNIMVTLFIPLGSEDCLDRQQ
jgi:hypothetical protein